MYVFVSICEVGFPLDNGLRSGIIVGGITAPADGILYVYIPVSSEMYQNIIFSFLYHMNFPVFVN